MVMNKKLVAAGLGALVALGANTGADAFSLRLRREPMKAGVIPHVSESVLSANAQTAQSPADIVINVNGGYVAPVASANSPSAISSNIPAAAYSEALSAVQLPSGNVAFQGHNYVNNNSRLNAYESIVKQAAALTNASNLSATGPQGIFKNEATPTAQPSAQQPAPQPSSPKKPHNPEDSAKLLEEIKALIAKHYGKDEGVKVTLETHLETDLEFDSLTKMELLLDIETEQGIEMPESGAEDIKTVGHIYNEVHKLKFDGAHPPASAA